MKHLSAILLLFLCVLTVQAQNLSVQDFRLDEADVTANTHGTTVMDQNGQKCALIKMITNQTGFTFDAGSLGIVKTEQHMNEVWIYVPEGVKRLTINHPQLGQIRDYDLGQMLRRARTYVLMLKTTLPQPVAPETQLLTINYTPAHAMVLIDSKPYKGSGRIETQLPLGSHNYIIAADGYETIEGSFKLTASAPRTITEKLVAVAQTANNEPSPPVQPVAQTSFAASPSVPAVKTVTVNGVSFNMIRVDGGSFMMGATAEQQKAYENEHPVHKVTLSSYYIGETEVTQELWQAVMGSNPSKSKGPKLPVDHVSWNDCQEFIYKLNQQTDLNFNLPTEAQWEYAARGGNKSKGYQYSGSNNIDDVAWYSKSKGKTHDVKTKQPNELGIYDMSGNVCEWCQDWEGGYSAGSQTNPTGASSGSYRVFRGGFWERSARYCRVALRYSGTPDLCYSLGLRLALQ